MVLGPIEGLKLAESENWAVLFLHYQGESIVSTCTSEFQLRFPKVVIQLDSKRVREP